MNTNERMRKKITITKTSKTCKDNKTFDICRLSNQDCIINDKNKNFE